MALIFPASPTLNQTYTSGSTVWTWQGTTWAKTSTAYIADGSITTVKIANLAVTIPKLATTVTDAISAGGSVVFEKNYKRSGSLSIITSGYKWYVPTAISITGITARLETGPTGSSAVFAIKNNGVLAATLTINAGTTISSTYTTPIPIIVNNYITVDITAIGSIIRGSDLTITFTYIRT